MLQPNEQVPDTKEALDDTLDQPDLAFMANMYVERAQMQAKQNQMQRELDDLLTREYERVQDNTGKLLSWTLSMAPLFIDPVKLMKGSPLGVNSSGADTYSGTYKWTDDSQPTQVSPSSQHLDRSYID